MMFPISDQQEPQTSASLTTTQTRLVLATDITTEETRSPSKYAGKLVLSSNGKSRRTAHETDGAGPRCRSRLVPRNHRQKKLIQCVRKEKTLHSKLLTTSCRPRFKRGQRRSFPEHIKTRILQIDFPDRVCIGPALATQAA
ncbi:AIF_collapsed_G0031660.mRNA.1.CDS.1 [Saccharomyces cerevisiae]|nr:AIF_collapsed_G0031660.mRNA.1.CDS.1 [Saccharomyces cerevisiae]